MKIILYHQEGCGQCKMAEMLLKKENIEYDSCTDVDEMKEKGITQTPVLSVDENFYYGAKGVKEWIESRR